MIRRRIDLTVQCEHTHVHEHSIYYRHPSFLSPSYRSQQLLQGTIVNRTYGTHKKHMYFPFSTNNIWSY